MRKDVDGDRVYVWAGVVQHMLEELSLHDSATYEFHARRIVDACVRSKEYASLLPRSVEPQAVLQARIATRDYEF
jgi:hypothetical protein